MPDPSSIDATLVAPTRQPFRAKFHLGGRDVATVELRGMETIREHAVDVICHWIDMDIAASGRRAPR